MFGQSFTDILSGYRAFSRRFVKSFPISSGELKLIAYLALRAPGEERRRSFANA